MKKICGAFIAILMLGCFVGCNNNPSDDSSSKDDSLLGEITYTKPTLPESVGKDPFEGITILTVKDEGTKILVDSKAKTLTLLEEDQVFSEMEYSYQNTDDGVILSVVNAKVFLNDKLVSVENLNKIIENLLIDSLKNSITKQFDYYDEYYGSENWSQEDWQARIDDINFEFDTSFTTENFIRENLELIFEQAINTSKSKENLLLKCEEYFENIFNIFNCKIILSNINGTQAELSYQGIYDESKKWYEQTSVWFYGSENSDENYVYLVISNGTKFLLFNRDYAIDSIDDSVIKIFYYDENNEKKYRTYSYTKTGSGYDTVIYVTIDGIEIDVTPRPINKFSY